MTEATIKPLAVTVLLLTALGCTSIHESDYVNGPDYVPANVYEIQLPPEVRRVAILPLSSARRDQNHLEGVKISEPLLRRELSARQAFESRSVPAAWLKRHTGKPLAGRRTAAARIALPARIALRVRCRAVCPSHGVSSLSAHPDGMESEVGTGDEFGSAMVRG
jgi:hypothetical protein